MKHNMPSGFSSDTVIPQLQQETTVAYITQEKQEEMQSDRKTYNELEDKRESIFSVNDVVQCDNVGVLEAFQ